MDWLKVLTQDVTRALLMGDLREFGDLLNLAWESKQQIRCFARQVGAHGREGDVIKGLPTSGNSGNVRQAIEADGDKGMTVIGHRICEPLEQVLC